MDYKYRVDDSVYCQGDPTRLYRVIDMKGYPEEGEAYLIEAHGGDSRNNQWVDVANLTPSNEGDIMQATQGKFALGDRVQYTDHEGTSVIGYVRELGSKDDVSAALVVFPDDGEYWIALDQHLELVDQTVSVDPKQSQGTKKMCFDAIPITLMSLLSKPSKDGADKYGLYNWLDLDDETMSVSTYLNAVQRHLLLYKAGQDNASDSGLHHLDHIMAGCAVVRDAMVFGKVKDDRIKLSKEQLETFENLINNT